MKHIKIISIIVLLAATLHSSVATPAADPVRQLRVPRIYNALITSNEKLQPSRAYPHSAPVLQPLGPVFGPPLTYTGQVPEDTAPPTEQTMGDKQTPYPLTFYPRQVGYYPQPFYPYQHPYAGVYPYRPAPLLYAPPLLQQLKVSHQGRSEEVDDDYEEEDTTSEASRAPAQ